MFLLELFRSQSEVGCEGTKDECRAEALNLLVKIRRLYDHGEHDEPVSTSNALRRDDLLNATVIHQSHTSDHDRRKDKAGESHHTCANSIGEYTGHTSE